MTRLRTSLARLMAWLRRRRQDDAIHEEIQTHLDLLADAHVRNGASPETARAAAKREFGGVEQVKEAYREQLRFRWLDDALADARYALRGLSRDSGFTVTAVLTLALGIGVNVAIFSIVNAVLVRPLPFTDSDRLVHLLEKRPATALNGRPTAFNQIHANDFLEWRRRSETLSHLAAYDERVGMTFGGSSEPIRLVGASVTPSIFPLLGVPPLLGHAFVETDAPQTVVLSHRMWQGMLGGDSDILGRAVALDGTNYRVVAVMPPAFVFPDPDTAFWVPLSVRETKPGWITDHQFIGRLKDGVPIEAARIEAQRVVKGIRGHEGPDEPLAGTPELDVVPVKHHRVAPVRDGLLVLLAGVGFVLLIAGVNIANLLLARHTARQGEAAVRVALGAGRSRLARQMLTESVLLALIGGAAGIAVAYACVEILERVGPADFPRLEEIGVDRTVLAFAVGLSTVTGLLLGLLPTLRLSRVAPIHAIKSDAGMTRGYGTRARGVLVSAQVAMATMLLIGGGLHVRSFLNLVSVAPGFDSTNLLVFQVAMPRDPAARAAAAASTDAFRARLETLPGVRAVAVANQLPFRRRSGTSPMIRGVPMPVERFVEARMVSRNYLDVMGVRVLAGRGLTESDGGGQPMVILVNETLARHFGGRSPVGETLTVAQSAAEIVGIVNDTHEAGLDVPPQPQAYIDARQTPLSGLRESAAMSWGFFAVKTAHDPMAVIPDVRRVLHQLVPEATLELNVNGMDSIISTTVARRRFYAFVLGLFAALAIALGAIGIYGVMAYSVIQRTREIGIRTALGATRSAVGALVLRQGMVCTAAGLVTGVAGAGATTRYMDGMLFGITPFDAATFIGATTICALVAAVASLLPVRRAIQVDPLVALRWE